jgi:hypothetical protein
VCLDDTRAPSSGSTEESYWLSHTRDAGEKTYLFSHTRTHTPLTQLADTNAQLADTNAHAYASTHRATCWSTNSLRTQKQTRVWFDAGMV